jgi:hypothetical protein
MTTTTAPWEDLLENHLVEIFKRLPLVDLVAGCSQVSRSWYRALCNQGGQILLASAGIVAVPVPVTLSWPRAMALALAAKYVPLDNMTWAVEPATLSAALEDPIKLLRFELPKCDASAIDLWTIVSQVPECAPSPALAQLVLRSIAEGDYTAFLRIATEFFHTKGSRGHAYYDIQMGLVPSACSGPDGVPWGHWALFFGRPGFTDVACMQPHVVWSLPLLLCSHEELFMGYLETAVAYSRERSGYLASKQLPVNRGLPEYLVKVTEPAFIHAALAFPHPPTILLRIGEVTDLLRTIRGNIPDWALVEGSLKVATTIIERFLCNQEEDKLRAMLAFRPFASDDVCDDAEA